MADSRKCKCGETDQEEFPKWGASCRTCQADHNRRHRAAYKARHTSDSPMWNAGQQERLTEKYWRGPTKISEQLWAERWAV